MFVLLFSGQVQDGGGQDADEEDLQAQHALHQQEVVQDRPEVSQHHRKGSCGEKELDYVYRVILVVD